ncbi:hypothetical protein MARLIPOL_13969 [Marinobacter lipolyticus SM19]|uniref:Lipoprotein n=1 Tax=Marinobacter lipolyticus SM19 TaxID=1318628 RepID=R8AYY2_9GAMM|nr:hypothetical protein [Marinobacter lipolyticus]EON91558.1 hypothetical protein MARLIPOL_13969 [Marinobacter lipolyticus SM19]
MKCVLSLSVLLITLTMAGCGEKSDELPVDGRDFDGVGYSEPAPYTGRVIDGYLRNARVWLDIDGDSQYSPGPLTVVLDSGTEVILPEGEPTAMSGANGVFSLDIQALVRNSAEAPDIDPREYSLYALTLPGKTVEQLPDGDRPVDSAYLMSAPPGVRQVTPLTTLARFGNLVSAGSAVSGSATPALTGVNLLSDYIQSGDQRAHAYARAFARFMASQFPAPYNEALAANGADGTERLLSRQAAYLLGLSLVRNASDIVAIVDEAASPGGYADVDVSNLALPEVALDLSDPMLLTRQVVSAQSEYGDLPASPSSLMTTAELSFDYEPDGRVRVISADGCMAPSMTELARLVSVGGRMASLETQWLPSISLSLQSRVAYENDGVDERLTFDWEHQRIYFETTTQCQDGLADTSEFGGPPEVTYSWVREDDGVAELTATSDNEVRVLQLDYANGTPLFAGHRLLVNEVEQAVLSLGELAECVPVLDVEGSSHVVSAQQNYSYAAIDAPVGFDALTLEFDIRNEYFRLLRYSFADMALAGLDHVSSDGGFDWIMVYPEEGAAAYVDDQPNLIADAYLTGPRTPADCGREFEEVPFGVFGQISYEYQRLSGYLAEQAQ